MRIVYIVNRCTSQDTFIQSLYDILVTFDSRSGQTTQCTAILFGDDYILSYIDQTTGQITGIGRLQCGIGQTFTGTVGRDEVLQHGQTLLEVRKDRVFDDLSSFGAGFLRFGHQTTHTGQLTDLLFRTTGSGIQHHVNRVEALHV